MHRKPTTHNGAYTYTWKKGGSTVSTTAAGAGSSSYSIASATAGDAGSYTVIAQNTTAGCTAYDQTSSAQAITVNAPAVTLNGINASYKEGGASKSPTNLNGNTITADQNTSCTLTASTSGTSGTVLYEWSTSSSFASIAGTGSTYSPSTASIGNTTYYLRTRAYTGSCTTAFQPTKSVTVSVASACPTPSFTVANCALNTQICFSPAPKKNTSSTMTVTAPSSVSNCPGCSYEYTWWAATGSSGTSNNNTAFPGGKKTNTTNSISFTPSAGGSFYWWNCEIKATNNCGKSTTIKKQEYKSISN